MAKNSSKKAKSQRSRERALLQKVHLNAAGIDVGADAHWVAVPEDRDPQPVRRFGVFTSDLVLLCHWLKSCQIETIVMESTGVYWIALFQVLERHGFEVRLVNASHVKNVPGRKTDVLDCQWLQQLHTFGLLRGSFRPEAAMCVARSYLRLRDTLTKDSNSLVQRMQKALTEMNVQIHRVISDITGLTGMSILRAILAGERNCVKLAQLRHPQIKSSSEVLAKALEGDYCPEHLFALQTALELYDSLQLKMLECDQRIEETFQGFEAKISLPAPDLSRLRSAEKRRDAHRRHRLQELTGADLTALPGLDLLAVERILSEIGRDMTRWPTEKHFCRWLGVAPDNRISGGRPLPSKPRKNANRAAAALRLAAQSAMQSKSALGAFIRRIKSRLGAPTAINAGAHKLARLLYRMLKFGTAYVEAGQHAYEKLFKERMLRNLQRKARDLGFEITPIPSPR
ncbi:MAG: IS110 family transposase [Verrucomicrobia bacterium]|nr:IS110 family transposase [Verrucomicrobiota bacterium]